MHKTILEERRVYPRHPLSTLKWVVGSSSEEDICSDSYKILIV